MSLVRHKLNYISIGIILAVFRLLQSSEGYQSSITNVLNNEDFTNSATLNSIKTPEVRCGGNCGCNCCGGCGCGGNGCWGDGGSGDGAYAAYVYPVYVPVVYIVDNNADAGTSVASNSFGASAGYAGNGANAGYGNCGYRSGYEAVEGCRCGYSDGSECCDCNCGNRSYFNGYGNCVYGNGCYDNCGCCAPAYGRK